ncbi:hypothetical protein [Rhodoblastus sp.]|uniref:hypothetical protein n=1 Tax=Rhodoblastus sp. TaxID=1962975 RepID=UPI003F952872
MMGETTFLIVPFDGNAEGKLQPGAPARLDTDDAARFAARQFADFHAGIVIIEEPVAAFVEPRLVATIGRVPAETLEIFGTKAKARKRRLIDQLLNLANSVRRTSRDADGLSHRRDFQGKEARFAGPVQEL